MRHCNAASLLLIVPTLILAGCATPRPLAKWEPPLPRTEFQTVRTTAYNDGEADHIKYTNHNALGTTLQCGRVNSAAADWGRWPAGTVFRILQTNETYVVDDYGWAIAGTNTIDLYKPSRAEMNRWGVQHVDIQVVRWGDPRLSYETLLPRGGYRHVARMLRELRPQLDNSAVAANEVPTRVRRPEPVFVAPAPSRPVAAAVPVSAPGVALTPFY